MHELHTEIEIDAMPERVWHILMDFASYPRWNPFIRYIQGSPEVGQSLRVRLQPSGASGMTFRPTVLVAERPRELRWLGRLLMPGIFDGEHRFVIEARSDHTVRFRQSERFTGMLVPLFRRSLDRDTRRGFTEMNAALKLRAECNGTNDTYRTSSV
jgi:hypothetical protein